MSHKSILGLSITCFICFCVVSSVIFNFASVKYDDPDYIEEKQCLIVNTTFYEEIVIRLYHIEPLNRTVQTVIPIEHINTLVFLTTNKYTSCYYYKPDPSRDVSINVKLNKRMSSFYKDCSWTFSLLGALSAIILLIFQAF